MDKKTLHLLEYDKVIIKLVDLCGYEPAKELAQSLLPSSDIEEIEGKQEESSEAREMLRLYPNFPSIASRDIRPFINKAQKGGILEGVELLAVKDTLETARSLKVYLEKTKEEFRYFKQWAKRIVLLPELEKRLKESIREEDGEILDTASAKLYQIRREKERLRLKIKEELDKMVRSPHLQKYLQENLVTVRQGRYVLPVKGEFREKIKGLVHDQSASGATLFIEPFAVVELNNKLRLLLNEEQNEIELILEELSALTAKGAEELFAAVEALAYLEFMLAKGRLSARMDAREVKWNKEHYLILKKARHPFLYDKAVPIDVVLGKDYDILVITGPNTGGKTVALKTVGILSLMAQAGLHIPCAEGTTLYPFTRVFADIGDEQSIEQSLSTFSSHMNRIVLMLKEVSNSSLVLLDELGAGTDPEEGSALACAILEELLKTGCLVIATTHFSALKSFAYATPRVENASVEFDPVSLKPTYRLLIGLPGKSNALEIGKRLGLPFPVIQRARQYLKEGEVEAAELISELNRHLYQARKEREEIDKLKEEISLKKEEAEKLRQELVREKEEARLKALDEASRVVEEAEEKSRALIRIMEEKLASGVKKEEAKEFYATQKTLREMKKDLKVKNNIASEEEKLSKVEIGQIVYFPKLKQNVKVISRPDERGNLAVEAGRIKLSVNLKELRRAASLKDKKPSLSYVGQRVSFLSAKENISPEIDLHGKTADEAIYLLDNYLDRAVLSGLSSVRIVHGKGTGTLRRVLQEHLKNHPQIKSYRNADATEGGIGVTIAEIK